MSKRKYFSHLSGQLWKFFLFFLKFLVLLLPFTNLLNQQAVIEIKSYFSNQIELRQ